MMDKKTQIRMFEVTDGTKIGLCYSHYDHFEIEWADGFYQSTIELSLYGIKKTFRTIN